MASTTLGKSLFQDLPQWLHGDQVQQSPEQGADAPLEGGLHSSLLWGGSPLALPGTGEARHPSC